MPNARKINRTMGCADWAMLIALSLLWGCSFLFVEVALDALEPFTIVALRVGLAAIALNIAVIATGHRMQIDGRVWGAFLGMGFLNNLVPFSLIVWGQTQITSGLASILNATTPLFTVVVAHFLTRDEKMTGGGLAGVIIGFVGVVVMIGPEAMGEIGLAVLAQLAILSAALFYAFASVFGRRFGRMGVAPLVAATGQVTASSAMIAPVAVIVEQPWMLPAMPGSEVWGAVIALALLSTACAYVLYFRLLASAGATNLLLVTFLIPVSAIMLGTGILGERLDSRHFAGMALIGLGLAAIDGRAWRAFTGSGKPELLKPDWRR